MTSEEKKRLLDRLFEEMSRDKSLPLSTNLVFGEGSRDCAVMFIGEAPGFNEDVEKRPFVGRGGQLLRRCVRDIGWREEDVYITNIVKRRPPDNRDPLPEEIEKYKPYLTRQIQIVNPMIIVPLGRFAMNYFLPDAKITRDQGKVFRLAGRLIYPMFHPAAALRSPGTMKEFVGNFRRLPLVVKKGIALPQSYGVAEEARDAKIKTGKSDGAGRSGQPKLF